MLPCLFCTVDATVSFGLVSIRHQNLVSKGHSSAEHLANSGASPFLTGMYRLTSEAQQG